MSRAPPAYAPGGPPTLGPYRLIRRIAAGGMAEVWEARHRDRPNEPAAVKTLPMRGEPLGPTDLRRFLDEGRLAIALEHPNVVRTFEVAVDGDRPYLAMELLQGCTLAQLSMAGNALPLGFVTSVGAQLLDGLGYAHDRFRAGGASSLVHRDIKPSNLFVTTEGVAKVIDFGIAILPASDRTQTATGLIRGTVAYSSPEQVRHEQLDTRSDLFSMGLVLFELVTGRRAFNYPTDAEVLSAVLWSPVPPAAQLRPGVSRNLAQLLAALLEKDRARRPGSAGEVAKALRAGESAERPFSPEEIGALVRERMPAFASKPAGTAQTVAPGIAQSHSSRWQGAGRGRAVRWGAPALLLAVALAAVSASFLTRRRAEPVVPPNAPVSVPPAPAPKVVSPPAKPERPEDVAVARKRREVSPPRPKGEQRPSEKIGWVTVGLRSGWGQVMIDGAAVGPTPVFRRPIAPGPHRVTVTRPDGTRLQRTVRVEAGKAAKLVIE